MRTSAFQNTERKRGRPYNKRNIYNFASYLVREKNCVYFFGSNVVYSAKKHCHCCTWIAVCKTSTAELCAAMPFLKDYNRKAKRSVEDRCDVARRYISNPRPKACKSARPVQP
eukprot:4784521-Amphidinium_carterae.1